MKRIFFYIIFITGIVAACTSKESNTNENRDSVITVKKHILDSTVIIKTDSSNKVNSEPDSIIGIVYVKNKSGTLLKEPGNKESNHKITLEFGTKLHLIYPFNDEQKYDSAWIKIKMHNYSCGDRYGYVSRFDLIDSSDVDFSKIPKEYSRELNRYPNGKINQGNLKFKFSKINSTEFNKYKTAYNRQIIEDTTKNSPDKHFFTLSIGDFLYKFHYNNSCEHYEHYMGYIKPLNAYVIEGCNVEFCSTYLIDKFTGKLFYLDGGSYIQGTRMPYVSKDETKFIVFTPGTPSDEFGTYMVLYKKDPVTGHFNFTEYDSFSTDKWEIEELVWVDNQTIALKCTGNIGYLKGIIIK